MKKQIKDLKIGDKFKFDMVNPKGFLTLKVIDFENTGEIEVISVDESAWD